MRVRLSGGACRGFEVLGRGAALESSAHARKLYATPTSLSMFSTYCSTVSLESQTLRVCCMRLSPWNAHDIIKPDVTYHKNMRLTTIVARFYIRVQLRLAAMSAMRSLFLAFSNSTTPRNRKRVHSRRLQPPFSILDRSSNSSDNGAKYDIVCVRLLAVM